MLTCAAKISVGQMMIELFLFIIPLIVVCFLERK